MKRNMFSKMLAAVLLLATVSLMSACTSNEDNAAPATEVVTIDGAGVVDHAVSLEMGQTLQLTASPTDRLFEWKSDNEQVVTVTADGLVTAVGMGEACVIVTIKDFYGFLVDNFVFVKVADKGLEFVDDRIDQSRAE